MEGGCVSSRTATEAAPQARILVAKKRTTLSLAFLARTPGASARGRSRLFSQSVIPLGMFIGSTFLAITFMGGVYAVLPAYEADLFGEFFATFDIAVLFALV